MVRMVRSCFNVIRSQDIHGRSYHSRKYLRTLDHILDHMDAGDDVPSVVAILPHDNYAGAFTG